MILSTSIIRVQDALPLSASTDDKETSELSECKSQIKILIKKINLNSEDKCTIENGSFVIHYLINNGACYICVCEKNYPRKVAFSYLDELSREFFNNYGNEYDRKGLRPYYFMKFDDFIQKTKKIYQDSRAQDNLTKLNEDLQDVTRVMTKNMEDLLWRGDSLNRMSTLSDQLKGESLKYKKDARSLNLQLLYRKFGIPAAIIFTIVMVLYLRTFFK